MINPKSAFASLLVIAILCTSLSACQPAETPTAFPRVAAAPLVITPEQTPTFDMTRAYQHVEAQVALGPRTPFSAAHSQVIEYISSELTSTGWQVEQQKGEYNQQPLINIIAKKSDAPPQIILGAHYDSRFFADHDADPALSLQPVLGANDGASGVAVLMELARVLPDETASSVWLIFFDAEDQGRITGWDWIQGSRYFAEHLSVTPQAVVIVDMVGDQNLKLPLEQNSTAELAAEIWSTAAQAGWDEYFIAEPGFSILDDHTPFLEKNIPAVDIIDFDYPYWHTSQDTLDKIDPHSLYVVGETLRLWLIQRQ